MGNDGCTGQFGWYVDSVDVYACTPDSLPEVGINHVRVEEGTDSWFTPATFTVSLSHPDSKPVWVWYKTVAASAMPWLDFIPKAGLLQIPPLETSVPVRISVRADDQPERNEAFFVVLGFAVNGTLGSRTGVGVIVNDDF